MSRASRRDKAEAQLRALEAQFSDDLVDALRECAAGAWGLFGRNDSALANDSKPLWERLRSRAAESLITQGEHIRQLRDQLGYTEPFPLFERYLRYREMRGANVPGEPKLAAQFLTELELESLAARGT